MISTAGDLASAIAVTVLEENDRLTKKDRDKQFKATPIKLQKKSFSDFCLPLPLLNDRLTDPVDET